VTSFYRTALSGRKSREWLGTPSRGDNLVVHLELACDDDTVLLLCPLSCSSCLGWPVLLAPGLVTAKLSIHSACAAEVILQLSNLRRVTQLK